ncbi:hypothetical protein NDU88_006763 [Pleurodeles waltl]|uniref:Uncharacterized protein n=1 Tax=Pleurodeles waltl TaxID=8319 RepID=A0AAV7RNE8_PLEWA|nr:hypothetical protein NDU88_006763 [Pleurodeles waltl]
MCKVRGPGRKWWRGARLGEGRKAGKRGHSTHTDVISIQLLPPRVQAVSNRPHSGWWAGTHNQVAVIRRPSWASRCLGLHPTVLTRAQTQAAHLRGASTAGGAAAVGSAEHTYLDDPGAGHTHTSGTSTAFAAAADKRGEVSLTCAPAARAPLDLWPLRGRTHGRTPPSSSPMFCVVLQQGIYS